MGDYNGMASSIWGNSAGMAWNGDAHLSERRQWRLTYIPQGLRGIKQGMGIGGLDNDGRLDLFIVGESYDPPQGNYAQVYRNTGAASPSQSLQGVRLSIARSDMKRWRDIIMPARYNKLYHTTEPARHGGGNFFPDWMFVRRWDRVDKSAPVIRGPTSMGVLSRIPPAKNINPEGSCAP